MNLKDWIRQRFFDVGTSSKTVLYSMYNEACDELERTIPLESYSRSVRAVYNELYGTDDASKLTPIISNKLTGMGTVLVVPDLHAPWIHKDALEFCKAQYVAHECSAVVFIGDLLDGHAISYHETNPDGMSAGNEFDSAVATLKDWYEAFPVAYVCFGNHDLLISRKAQTHGLPNRLFKTFGEIIESPKGWQFNHTWEIDGVKYLHGTGGGGKTAHMIRALKNRQSTVLGHFHSTFGVGYMANTQDLSFGMAVGCLIDISSYAMEYGKDFLDRPILGCGIVKSSSEAYTVPMRLE